eukprot:9424213-Pyramimonas_sp.AAC.1
MNDHASYFEQQVHEAGTKAFKTGKVHPTKPRLQPSTFALTRVRRACQRPLRRLRQGKQERQDTGGPPQP